MDQLVNDADKLLPPADDAPPEPVEIEIEPEDGAPPPAGAAPKPKQPSRRDQRVANALQAAQQADERAIAAEARARAAEERAAKADSDRQVATASGMENYAQRIKAEGDQAQHEYEQALAGGDPKTIAEAARKVSKVAAAEADVDAWRASQPAPGAEPAPPAPQAPAQPQQQQQTAPPPEVASFLLENNWFNPFQLDAQGRPMADANGQGIPNAEYDPEMHDAAMLLHKGIERKVRLGKLPQNYFASQEYFDEIRAEMATRFPDAFGEEEEPAPPPTRRAPPMTPARTAVAPATRGAAPARPGATQKITLDGETAAFVRSLVDNGTMRYPRNHSVADKRGQPMDYSDAYKEYARQQRLQPQHTQN